MQDGRKRYGEIGFKQDVEELNQNYVIRRLLLGIPLLKTGECMSRSLKAWLVGLAGFAEVMSRLGGRRMYLVIDLLQLLNV